jgi:DNA segregation ATPase FtsK/SpoIIIE-like protein
VVAFKPDGHGNLAVYGGGPCHVDGICQLATDGRPVGVHVLITADRPASVPSALASAMQTRVVLRTADPNDYQSMNVPADVVKPSSPSGRGMLQDVEVQVAILGKQSDVGSQLAAKADEIESIANVLSSQLNGVQWLGHDADMFRNDWQSTHRTQLNTVSNALRDASTRATAHANQQEQASA